MTVAIYPGSFDPITNGHIDVLERASKLFDDIIIAVSDNPSKNPFFSLEDRMDLIRQSINIENVEVGSFSGLTVDYAREKKACVLIRGLRAVSDFEYEMQMSQMNKTLFPELETIFLVPRVEYSFLSSSIVKQVAMLGGDISQIVPEPVNQFFKNLKANRDTGQLI